MGQHLSILRRLLSKPGSRVIDTVDCDGQPIFDKKYSIIIKRNYQPGYIDMLEWVNLNSNNSVDVKFNNAYGSEAIYIGFENSDDALFFKIKYSI